MSDEVFIIVSENKYQSSFLCESPDKYVLHSFTADQQGRTTPIDDNRSNILLHDLHNLDYGVWTYCEEPFFIQSN